MKKKKICHTIKIKKPYIKTQAKQNQYRKKVKQNKNINNNPAQNNNPTTRGTEHQNNKGKPPSRSNSSTNKSKEERFKRQIKHLQEELDNLK